MKAGLLLLLLLLSCFSRVRLCVTPETAAHQASPSPGFSRQEHWGGLPFPFPMHESEVAQSCPTLCDPMDWSLPGSSVHGIFQARVLEWGAISFSGRQDNMRQIQETRQSDLSREALSSRNMLVTSVILIFNTHILKGLKR